jgi:type IV fimbrial biogenesis protein FimT
MNRSRHGGFTLLELMITLALAGILVTLAVPSMRQFMRNGRLATASNDLLHSLSIARTEAIKRQKRLVTVCASADPNAAEAALTCSYGTMSGWIVFVDDVDAGGVAGQFDSGTDTVLSRGEASDKVTVKSDHDGIVCFSQTGFQPPNCGGQEPTQHVVICDERGDTAMGADSTARTVLITQTGRSRVSRLHADVSAALAAMGVSCP